MKRLLAHLIALAWLLPVCGGKLAPIEQPRGHAGPDGGFVGADGGSVILPGSGCAGYDPTQHPLPAQGPYCKSHAECVDWALQQVPSGFPVFAVCVDAISCDYYLPIEGAGVSTAFEPVQIYCTPGIDGDAFCSAYFSQFVLGDGSTRAACVAGTSFAGCVANTSCYRESPDGGAGDGGTTGTQCGAFELCVTRAGVTSCEPPCLAAK